MGLHRGREGSQPPDRPARAAYEPKGDYSNDELKFVYRHFLGPDPFLEPRTFRRDDRDGDRLFTGDVNNLPSTVGGGGVHADGKLPRFREIDFRLRIRARPDRRRGHRGLAARATTSSSRTTWRSSGRSASPATPTANPFAAWRSGPYPMPPGPDMYGATLSTAAAERHGLHPYRGADRCEQRALRRSACVQQLRVLWSVRLSDPREGRPGRHAAARPAHRPVPHRTGGVRHPRHGGPERPPGHRRRVPRSRRAWRTSSARITSCSLAGAFETPRLLLRSDLANSSGLVGRNLMFHFQTLTVGAFPHPLLRRPRPSRHAPPRRPHGPRRRRPRRPRARPGSRTSVAASSSTVRPRRRCSRPRPTAPGRPTTCRWRARTCAIACGSSPCRARTSRNRPTPSTSIRTCETSSVSRPAG